jgi:hypothetical protein
VEVCSLDFALPLVTVRNRSQPHAMKSDMAEPIANAAKAIKSGHF